jgi:Phage protein (N4 Gp49/phage Sf6 gene 66) family
MTTLQQADAEAAALAVAPRVTLADIEAAIAAVYHTTADKAISDAPRVDSLKLLSICILVMRNGFTVIGKSAPASAENFNADFGRKLAYEDAVRQLWPLMGFALRERLYNNGTAAA